MIRLGLQVILVTISASSLSLPAFGASAPAQPTAYARMAPLQRYLMPDRQAEIALARTAAPSSISSQATILVLTPHGYQTAENGSNGFTCLVERPWMSPFDDPEFWNWKKHAPVCYNAAASRTILPYTILETDLILNGLTRSAILGRISVAVADKQLPTAAPGSVSYMMSKRQYLSDAHGAWMPHLMLYAPKSDTAHGGASWGANLSYSPIVLDTEHHVNPHPWTLFYVVAPTWSDGSPAPHM